jgi:hypothetical protein
MFYQSQVSNKILKQSYSQSMHAIKNNILILTVNKNRENNSQQLTTVQICKKNRYP